MEMIIQSITSSSFLENYNMKISSIYKMMSNAVTQKIRFPGHFYIKDENEVKVKVAQSCPTLCDPMVYTVPGILWARILEWVAFPFSRVSSQPRDWTQVSHIAGRCFTSWATREAPYKGWREQIALEHLFFTTVGKTSSECLLFLSQKEAKTIRPMAWYRDMWKLLSCVWLFAIP